MIPTDITKITNDFKIAIDNIYKEKLLEYTNDISYKLGDGYTKDYGKIGDIDKNLDIKIINQLHLTDSNGQKSPYYSITAERKFNSISDYHIVILKKIQNDAVIKNAYLIDIIDTNINYNLYTSFSGKRSLYVIDNYGNCIFIKNTDDTTYNVISDDRYKKNIYDSNSSFKLDYQLPDIFIDYIKQNNHYLFPTITQACQFLSKHYHEKFIKYNKLFNSGKLVEYTNLVEQIEKQDKLHSQYVSNLNIEISQKNNLINQLTEERDKISELFVNDTEKMLLKNENETLKTKNIEYSNNINIYTKEIADIKKKLLDVEKENKRLTLLNKKLLDVEKENKRVNSIQYNGFTSIFSNCEKKK